MDYVSKKVDFFGYFVGAFCFTSKSGKKCFKISVARSYSSKGSNLGCFVIDAYINEKMFNDLKFEKFERIYCRGSENTDSHIYTLFSIEGNNSEIRWK